MKDILVLEKMIERGHLPKDGPFEVDDSIIDIFYNTHRELYIPRTNKKPSPSDLRYARRLAGLSLMKLSMLRSSEEVDTKKALTRKPNCGIVYLITNPAFPGMCKIGMTKDLPKRLSQYQTGDPYRRYKVEKYKFVENAKKEEDRLLKMFNTDLSKGEWVPFENVSKLFYG